MGYCGSCGGNGWMPMETMCSGCGGSGQNTLVQDGMGCGGCGGSGRNTQMQPCPNCNGTGGHGGGGGGGGPAYTPPRGPISAAARVKIFMYNLILIGGLGGYVYYTTR